MKLYMVTADTAMGTTDETYLCGVFNTKELAEKCIESNPLNISELTSNVYDILELEVNSICRYWK